MGLLGRRGQRRVIRRAAERALAVPMVQAGDGEPAGHGPPLGDNRRGTRSIPKWPAGFRPRPWYRTKRATTVLAAVGVSAIVVWGVLLVLRGPGIGAEESTTVVPEASPTVRPETTSAQPAPSSVQRTGTNAPLLPPDPPPPPTSVAKINPAPVVTRQNPSPGPAAPSERKTPEIGVTRTPATRSPISAAPPPRQPPETNSATPGDARRSRWGWGF